MYVVVVVVLIHKFDRCLAKQSFHVLFCDWIHKDALPLVIGCRCRVASINKQDGEDGVEFDDFSHRVKRLEGKTEGTKT